MIKNYAPLILWKVVGSLVHKNQINTVNLSHMPKYGGYKMCNYKRKSRESHSNICKSSFFPTLWFSIFLNRAPSQTYEMRGLQPYWPDNMLAFLRC